LVAARQVGALERIKPKICEYRPIHLDRSTQPTARLIGKAKFEIVDTHGAQGAFGEVVDLVARRGSFSRDKIQLVIAVEMHLKFLIAKLLPRLELLDDVWLASGGDKGREPIEPGHDPGFDFAGRHMAWPADDARNAEAAFHGGSFSASERRLAAIRPG